MGSRLHGIIVKEFIQLRRDPLAVTLALFVPVAMLFIFGWAINTDVKHVPTAVLDQSGTVESLALQEALVNSQYFDVRYRAMNVRASTLPDWSKTAVATCLTSVLIAQPKMKSMTTGMNRASVRASGSRLRWMNSLAMIP